MNCLLRILFGPFPLQEKEREKEKEEKILLKTLAKGMLLFGDVSDEYFIRFG